jgi:hypothetical protein
LFWKGEKAKSIFPKIKSMIQRKEGTRGWNIPLFLALSCVVGLWIVISPYLLGLGKSLTMANFIVGPLTIAISFVACAEVFRSLRYIHLLLGLALIIPALILLFLEGGGWEGAVNNFIAGSLLILFCLPKGQILGRYGIWQRYIC